MFACEFGEITKNTFFTEHLRATASVLLEVDNKNIKTKSMDDILVSLLLQNLIWYFATGRYIFVHTPY